MNNYYILGFSVAIILLVLILFTTGEFKDTSKEAAPMVPDYVPYIPSQEGPSRGGFMMYEFKNLGVPGWKWGSCCSS